MGEAKQRQLSEIERRKQLLDAAQRRPAGPRILDAFDRPVAAGDVVLLSETAPMNTPWRVVQVIPATEPQLPRDTVWLQCVCQTRVLVHRTRNPHLVLAMPGQPAEALGEGVPEQPQAPEQAPEQAPAAEPGAARTPSGIILSDPDGMSER